MKDIILKEIKDLDLGISLVIKDLTNGRWILKYNELNIYPSASLIKIPIMIEVLYQVDQGRLELEDRIKIRAEDRIDYSLISDLSLEEYPLIDLIRLMIILSDNAATNVLIDLLGFEEINQRITKLGCKSTILQRKMLDFQAAKIGRENLTSPMDMAIIMEKIYGGSLCSDELCRLMIDILSRQKHRDMLARYIEDRVIIAHKTGSLRGLKHDIGLFYLRDIDYLLGVFTNNGQDDLIAKRTIGQVSKLVYDHYAFGSQDIRGDKLEGK